MLLGAVSLASAQTSAPPADVKKVMDKYACLGCHNTTTKIVGPSFTEIANKKKYSDTKMIELIRNPQQKNWPGYPPMAPIPSITNDEAKKVASWINSLRK